MAKERVTLDEETLAAYIAGTLDPEERSAVTAALVRDPDARELLAMAMRAMGRSADSEHRVLIPDRRAEKRRDAQAQRSGDKSDVRGR